MLKRLESAVTLLLWSGVLVAFVFVLIYQVPGFFGVKTFVVLSGSMEPVINVGAVEYINTHDRDVEEGDIVAYRASEHASADIVTHRVIEIDADGNMKTQGDANNRPDEGTVTKADIVGTYLFQIPSLGYALHAIGHNGKIAIVCVLAGMFILSNVLQSLVKHQEEKAKEKDEKGAVPDEIPADATDNVKEVAGNEES